jgi:phosphoglycerate dehydrogenase-like enzyme
MASGLGMKVIGHDPFVDSGGDPDIEFVGDLVELFERADVVSLHVPQTEQTRHLIDREAIGHFKSGAILINTARGGLVDHAALLDALDSGHLFGAGLDVTDPEPLPPDHPLLHRLDVVVTPHIATATRAGKARLYESAVSQCLQVLRGERPPHLVNPDVWPVKRPPNQSQETQ